MKTLLSVPRVALFALALGTASVTATYAQTSTTPPDSSDGEGHHHHHHDAILTADEKAQLKKAHEAALAADPTLKTEGDNLKQQFQDLKGATDTASQDQKKALHEQGRAYREKLRAAELKIDPTLAPIFAKLDAAHKAHEHHHSAEGA